MEDRNNKIPPSYTTPLINLRKYLIENYNEHDFKNSILLLKIFLLEQTNIENALEAINSKIGKKEGRIFNESLFHCFKHLVDIFFGEKNKYLDENHEEKKDYSNNIKDEVFYLENYFHKKTDTIKSLISPAQILQQRVHNYLALIGDGFQFFNSDTLLNSHLAETTRIYNELKQASDDVKKILTHNWIEGNRIRFLCFQSTYYQLLSKYVNEHPLQNREMPLHQFTPQKSNELYIEYLSISTFYLSQSYEKILLSLTIIMESSSPTYSEDVPSLKECLGLYEAIFHVLIANKNELIKYSPNKADKNIFMQFTKRHHNFTRMIKEKWNIANPSTETTIPLKSNNYDMKIINAIKCYDFKKTEDDFYSLMLSYENKKPATENKIYIYLRMYRELVVLVYQAYFDTDDGINDVSKKITFVNEMHHSILDKINELKSQISLGKKIIQSPEIDCIIASFIQIILTYDKISSANMSKRIPIKLDNIINLNKRTLRESLSDLILLCFHFQKYSFDENYFTIDHFYLIHSTPSTSDLAVLFNLIQEDIANLNVKLAYKNTERVEICPKKIAQADKMYSKLMAEYGKENEELEKKYQRKVTVSILEDKPPQDTPEEKDTNEKPRATLAFFTLPDENELYFKASKCEINATKNFTHDKKSNYSTAIKKYTNELTMAIVDYTRAKNLAQQVKNHKFVIGSLQEIASCYLLIAIHQPAANIAKSLEMYKHASKNAREALTYFDENIKYLNDDSDMKIEDLYKGIHIVMNSVTEAIAETEKYLKKHGEKLQAHLHKETALILKIITEIGPENWYVNKPQEERSCYSTTRKDKWNTLHNTHKNLSELNKIVHQDAVIDISLTYKLLFNDESTFPLEHLKTPDEEIKLSNMKAALHQETSSQLGFSDKFALIKNASLGLLLHSTSEETHTPSPTLR